MIFFSFSLFSYIPLGGKREKRKEKNLIFREEEIIIEHTERIHEQRTAMEPTPPDNPASTNSASL